METDVLCLHENLHLMDQCVDLLNSEWPRSKTARLRSLESGPANNLPMSLLLVTKNGMKNSVIGHSKLLPMPQDKEACFVASVVIQKNLRGSGLGRLLMERTEDFVRKKGIKCIYLSTHDKQDFYRKLGYELYDYNPVVIYGGRTLDMYKMFANEDGPNSDDNGNCQVSPSISTQTPTIQVQTTQPSKPLEQNSKPPTAPPPPPAPPPPKNVISIISSPSHSDLKVHMKKVLS